MMALHTQIHAYTSKTHARCTHASHNITQQIHLVNRSEHRHLPEWIEYQADDYEKRTKEQKKSNERNPSASFLASNKFCAMVIIIIAPAALLSIHTHTHTRTFQMAGHLLLSPNWHLLLLSIFFSLDLMFVMRGVNHIIFHLLANFVQFIYYTHQAQHQNQTSRTNEKKKNWIQNCREEATQLSNYLKRFFDNSFTF